VNIYDDGTTSVVPFGPDQEKAHFLDTGQQIGAVDPFTGQPVAGGGLYQKQQTPDSLASNQVTIRGQNMTDARSRELNAIHQATANVGQIVETPEGFARVGKDNSVTPIVADGAQLRTKPTGQVQQQIASNNVTLQKIDRAMVMAEKMPNAFGLKNYAGDPIMQRLDPTGVEARAMVADIAGQKIHDRSGAAVTVGEAQRLRPYVPNTTDTAEVVKKKLGLFKREYTAMQSELLSGKPLAAVVGSGPAGWSIQELP